MRKYIFFKDKPQYRVQMSTCEMWFRKCQIINGPMRRGVSDVVWATVIHRSDGPAVISKDGSYVRWIWADNEISVESWLEKVKENEGCFNDVELALLYLKYL